MSDSEPQSTPTLEEAYRLHHKMVYGLCLRMLRSQEDAEDAAQEVFLKLHAKLAQFRGDSAFTTWLHRVTVNHVLMRMRAAKSRARHAGPSLQELAEDADASGALERALSCEDARLRSVADRAALEVALGRVSGYLRMIVELCEMQGFTIEEASDLLGVSSGAVKSYLNRGRNWLAAEMGAPLRGKKRMDKMLADFERYL